MVPACRQAGSRKLKNMKPYSVYAIESKVDKRIYVGISQNPNKRLRSHNQKEVFSTKGYCPWSLVYTKVIGSRKLARKEEKRLKSGYGKEWLKKIIDIPR